jgi:hypothetical protein
MLSTTPHMVRHAKSILFILLCYSVSAHTMDQDLLVAGEQYHISIVDSNGRHIEVEFTSQSNLRDIAVNTVIEANLGNTYIAHT